MGSLLCRRVSNESASKTGLKLPEVLLAGYVEPREKVVPDAARGVVNCKEGRSGGWSDSLRLSQGDREFRQRWLIPLPEHLEHQIGAPASLKEGVRSGRLLREGGALRGRSQRNADLHDGTLRYLRVQGAVG